MRSMLPAALLAAALLPHPLLAGAAPPAGLWHATLEPVPGLEISFDLKVEAKGKALSGALMNGASESRFTSVSWDGETLTLGMDHYDGRLVARPKDGDLAGTFTRATASGKFDLPFRATRTAPPVPRPPKGSASVTGDWGVEMGEGEKAEKLLGTFRQDGGHATGTLLGPTGDYGPMHGTWDGKTLALTIFDGVFIYRLDGRLVD